MVLAVYFFKFYSCLTLEIEYRSKIKLIQDIEIYFFEIPKGNYLEYKSSETYDKGMDDLFSIPFSKNSNYINGNIRKWELK